MLNKQSPNSDENTLPQDSNDHEGEMTAKPVWSSKVVFYPPSSKYWRINNQWYDLSNFDHHPGGTQVLLMARDRFEDCTFVFEAHHHNYQHARKVLNKYLVTERNVKKEFNYNRPSSNQRHAKAHQDRVLEANKLPTWSNDKAFYSVLRKRVAAYLKEVGCPHGGPTWECIGLFWLVLIVWACLVWITYQSGSLAAAAATGAVASVLAAFGHNWVHQPKYKQWGWALLALDTVGYSSEGWYRDHVLQHHMYTNTPWDHHFLGKLVKREVPAMTLNRSGGDRREPWAILWVPSICIDCVSL